MEVMRDPWLEMQRDLAGASNTASHPVLDGAGHIFGHGT